MAVPSNIIMGDLIVLILNFKAFNRGRFHSDHEMDAFKSKAREIGLCNVNPVSRHSVLSIK